MHIDHPTPRLGRVSIGRDDAAKLRYKPLTAAASYSVEVQFFGSIRTLHINMPAVGSVRITKRRADDTTPINFTINGKPYTVGGEYDLEMTLNDYLREVACVTGTKVMCREGGCGCCAVSVTRLDHNTGKETTTSINSCLCPLYSVDGWHITTVEGLGNSKDGFHPIQKRIAKYNGTQCGYCTPGMVMNMYGILQKNPQPTEREIEDQFGGNICRCTGYRPILDAMKSFAKDSKDPAASCIDIEDLKICPRTGKACEDHGDRANRNSANGSNKATAKGSPSDEGFVTKAGDKRWYRPDTVQQLVKILQTNKGKEIRLVCGNTSTGVFKNEGPFDVYVDLHDIKAFSKIEASRSSFKFGSTLSISQLMDAMTARSTENGYSYFSAIVSHFEKIGNVLVRNAGSWAGNLMMKHAHPDFPSDIFTPLEAAGAQINILDGKDGHMKTYPLLSLVEKMDMTNKVIVSVELFKHEMRFRFGSYKIMPRSQNAHAYVNAAFRVTMDKTSFQVLGKPSLVYGGINKSTHHAKKTENLLTGKSLKDQSVIQGALQALHSELNPVGDQVLASPEFRRNLALNLFYKFILSITEPQTSSLMSGGQPLDRPVSSSQREVPEQKDEWPLKQPMPKMTAPLQASGEAVFVNDIPASTNTLYGAFAVTTIGSGTIDKIDPSKALLHPGVIDFFDSKSIAASAENNVMPSLMGIKFAPEELFCSGDVKYDGQAVGFIVAESQALADAAASKVKVTYKEVRQPVITIDDAIREGSYHANPMVEHKTGDYEAALSKATRKIKGSTKHGVQYHFYMESNTALAVPSENRMEVSSSCQGTDLIQSAVGMVLGKPSKYVHVNIPRVGGSFGGKTFTSVPVASATSLAAYNIGRPVKCSVDLSRNMKMYGKRFAVSTEYEIGFDDSGKIDVISIEVYADAGYLANMMLIYHELLTHLDQGYHIPNWRVKMIICKTNKAPSQPTRAPGPYPASFVIESMVEHVAEALGKDPADVKEINLYSEGQIDICGHELKNCTLRRIWQELRKSAEFDKRRAEVESFNKANLWKKRGITMSPCKYGFFYVGCGLTVDVSIYARDGSVTVSQGGVEMGQGLYTKMAQAVASSLGIPVSMITVLPVDSHISPNNPVSGGSTASEFAVGSALRCCEILNERMAPFKEKHPDYDWKNLVETCYLANVQLTAKDAWVPKKHDGPGMFQYFSFSAAVSEVELDVLTGESQIRRVDILFDCGESLNSTIDMGQIEGAFVMGLAGHMFEEVIYDKDTGRVLTDGTWEYKPPTTKDIPIDWRIKLLNDSKNSLGVRSSKASGEPPIMLSVSIHSALRQAMAAARLDITGEKGYQPSVSPLTVERLQLGCGFNISKMTI